ncbi:MAG: replicative DNA helicase [Eubacterium sp.]|nr:replicative DNA helicase [Eubacterium sp.]
MEENAITRKLPRSEEAERAVIGSMLMDREAVIEVSDILQREDFYNPQFGILFETMAELYAGGKAVDVLTLSDRLKAKNVPEDISSISFISSIVASVPTSANAKQYAEIVKDNSILRKLIKLTEDISKDCYIASDDVGNILDRAEQDVYKLSQARSGAGDFVPMKDIVVDVLNEIEEASRNRGRINGLPTGFIDLDNMLTGMHGGELLLVAARPSMGKTAFVLNIAHNVCVKKKVPAVIFSLEMGREQLVNRMLAIDAMVDAQALKTGSLEDSDWDKIIESTENIAGAPLFIDDDSTVTLGDLRSKCRKLKQSHNIGLIIIDYLQLMTPAKAVESRQQFISDMSRGLKSVARELNVPVIALSQLNRAVDSRADHRPVLADLRESGAIEQDADVVMFIYRDEYYNKDSEKPGTAEIIVAKQRNGAVGSVDLAWVSKYTMFNNLEH